MAEVVTVIATCSAPGCSEPGTNKCSACKITPYCSVACQTIDWSQHKEECQGHLRKLGMNHLEKAMGFDRERNWVQSLRFSELALTKLKKLHPRPFEVINIIDGALTFKFNALNFTNQEKQALECAQERYSLWAAGYMRHPGMLEAAFPLIEGLLHNHEYEQAALIANTAHEMIINDTDNIIPEEHRPCFLADGAQYLARATHKLANSGGIPPEAKQKSGEEAIALARKALEIHTQLYGAESEQVSMDIGILADVLQYFNGVDDDEILRLYERAIAIYRRVQGSLSPNVAVGENKLASIYRNRADTAMEGAEDANDLDRCMANLELSLTHYREAARIFTAINHVDSVDGATQRVAEVEGNLQQIRMQIAASSAATNG